MSARLFSSIGFRDHSHLVKALIRNCSSKPKTSGRYKFDKHDLKKRTIQPGEYAMLIFPAATFCLGVWQTKRRAWKLDLIDKLQKKTSLPPILMPEDLSDLEDLEYQKIFVRGRFDHSREAYIGPKSFISNNENDAGGGIIGNPDSVGWQVVTPFIMDGTGQTILINRGWVPKNRLNPATRTEGQVQEKVDLVGVVRKTEKREQFTPKNQNQGNSMWNFRDIGDMSQRLETLPVFLDADVASTIPGGPIGGQTKVTLRNDHLSYMFTWYSLSGAMLYLWTKRYFIR